MKTTFQTSTAPLFFTFHSPSPSFSCLYSNPNPRVTKTNHEMSSRRTHTKSRTGCLNCKRRKVKVSSYTSALYSGSCLWLRETCRAYDRPCSSLTANASSVTKLDQHASIAQDMACLAVSHHSHLPTSLPLPSIVAVTLIQPGSPTWLLRHQDPWITMI